MSGLGGNPMLVQGYVHTVPDRETERCRNCTGTCTV